MDLPEWWTIIDGDAFEETLDCHWRATPTAAEAAEGLGTPPEDFPPPGDAA